MAEEPQYSSQGSYYERYQIIPDGQENIPSSPPPAGQSSPARRTSPRLVKSSSVKPRGLPTITPKRFTKFFTPRSTLSGRGGRQSKAARTLRDITKNGANGRRHGTVGKDDWPEGLTGDGERSAKRRKTSLDTTSSPPQSSPLKYLQELDFPEIAIYEDEPLSPTVSNSDDRSLDSRCLLSFPAPVRRLGTSGSSYRILHREFGGYDALTRGQSVADHCVDWQAETANFVSIPEDVHSFHGQSLPFCSTSCNTNSLVAVGDEEGGVRLFDTSPTAEMAKAHVKFKIHSNAIMDITFSADDFILASASGDQTARLVDMHTQSVLCVLAGHESSVKQIRFQPNTDSVLTTSSRDGTVMVWDLRCSDRGSISSLRAGQRKGLNEDGLHQPAVRHARDMMSVGPAHLSAGGAASRAPSTLKPEETAVSITAIQHLSNGREHLLLTASERSASVMLWDLRYARQRSLVPLSSTSLPESHVRTRNFGVSSMVLSGDGARFYTLCRDSTVYAYSTNHLLKGCAPEMDSICAKRRPPKQTQIGLGPLYAFRHTALRTETFYSKMSLRPSRDAASEMLAVGSSEECAIIFPTDERHFSQRGQKHDCEECEGVPSMSKKNSKFSADTISLPVHQGTALVRGHRKEVTSVAWTHGGELLTIADDYTARCWREDTAKARHLRNCGEGGGLRWGHGWAAVEGRWDEDDC
ncbi:hypothetical protein M433DRAFT_168266 [Acidomyces richmondensis BFW]|nr:hypothetical protein M433DRAFT_168266 [Acidomyces richmondensis BFW]